MTKYKTQPGKSFPLGATVQPSGINFSIYSKNASAVELLLFDSKDHSQPTHTYPLDRKTNRTFHYWHIFIEGIKHGQLYGYRVLGENAPSEGLRFDGEKVLLDPYTRAVTSNTYDRNAAVRPGDNCAQAMKSVAIDNTIYDWEDDRPLNLSFAHSIIYELHVGGFTKNPNSGVAADLRGTYKGLIEKIPYLKSLGITTVELMPVQQFDPYDVPDQSLTNYWGYNPVAFFAPHNGYASKNDPVNAVDEFRDMVKALHREGISVLLDVVFNHTAEGNEQGPTLSFRGIENRAYYTLEKDQAFYKNFSGTGNTLRANHSVVRRMIRDCLRYWVSEMHVDGFRFDLASVLSRDEDGNPMSNAPILWSIDSGPVLASTKIIAEAWDLNLYQLGNFTGERWAEWNGRYRDDIRRFLKGDTGVVVPFAKRIGASPDIFQDPLRDPNRSINFITCHDGFTLNDLVSYNEKHNLSNGEGNRDGINDNHSWNCGHEGPTDDLAVEQLRIRQIKNFMTVLMVSQGTPMFTMGDEVRRTQHGNNNAYCQDNELGWFDWDLVVQQNDLLGFIRKLMKFNLSCPYFQEEQFWEAPEPASSTKFEFHGIHLNQPDWSDHSHSLAFTLTNPNFDCSLHVMVNAYWEPLTFALPEESNVQWKKIIDTSANSPNDIYLPEKAKAVDGFSCEVLARSVIVLYSG
ncbi:MAG: glycogen debranching protein GlgX [Bacteroidota bacterium]